METHFIQSLARAVKSENSRIRISSAIAMRELFRYGKLVISLVTSPFDIFQDEMRDMMIEGKVVASLVRMIRGGSDKERDEAGRVLYGFVRCSEPFC